MVRLVILWCRNVFHFFYFKHWISPCEVKQPTLFCRIPSYLNLKQITRKTNLGVSSFILCLSELPQPQIALIKMLPTKQKDWVRGSWHDSSFRATKLWQDKSCYGGAKTELVCPGRDASQPASQPASSAAASSGLICSGGTCSHTQYCHPLSLSLWALRAQTKLYFIRARGREGGREGGNKHHKTDDQPVQLSNGWVTLISSSCVFWMKNIYLISYTIWQVLQFQVPTGVEHSLLLKYFVFNLTEIILPDRGLMFLLLTADHILYHLPSPVISACLNQNRESVLLLLLLLLLLFVRLWCVVGSGGGHDTTAASTGLINSPHGNSDGRSAPLKWRDGSTRVELWGVIQWYTITSPPPHTRYKRQNMSL